VGLRVRGSYSDDGYALVEKLVPGEVASALLDTFWRDLRDEKLRVSFRQNHLLTRPAVELHGANSPAITGFLWGLTPAMADLSGCELLPSYAYFRLYQQGHRLHVHSDRDACEHSLSLTLGYSEGEVWMFEVGRDEAPARGKHASDFGEEPFSSIAMHPGDAVLYRGIRRRHGRLSPNPNKWSAHLFLHWVEATGPYREHAFEGTQHRAKQPAAD